MTTEQKHTPGAFEIVKRSTAPVAELSVAYNDLLAENERLRGAEAEAMLVVESTEYKLKQMREMFEMHARRGDELQLALNASSTQNAELLSALRELVEPSTEIRWSSESRKDVEAVERALRIARAAIAKAEGK